MGSHLGLATSDKVSRFGGRAQNPQTSDHFKLLETDGESLLVGAKNAVYNLSLNNLDVHHTIDWAPPATVIEECLMKGKAKQDCENYIRVLARQANGKMLICGTHAFKPMCREYVTGGGDGKPRSVRQFDGQAISPYDPNDNSTAVYLPENDEIYSGTVSDFVGSDPLIYRKRLSDKDEGIRTQRDDVRVLDSPNFVASFAYKEHVYFWYRERAAEAMDNNEERQVYARVARVCRNDKGAPRPANEKWTSFVKARLNCSLPSGSPFYFNELRSVSEPIPSAADHLIYAVFATPETHVRMSAICIFSMNKIRDEFLYGTFKHQKTVNSLWAPYAKSEIPKPRPGTCVPDSTKLPEATISFTLRNPLLHKSISSLREPLLVEGTDRADLTQIAVLPGVTSVANERHDVIFVGTSDGRVLKIVDNGGKTALIESVRVFQRGPPVVNLLTAAQQGHVAVVTPDEVALIPLHNCELQSSCSHCVNLQDPHCAWDLQTARCVPRDQWRSDGSYVQNIFLGRSEQCPEAFLADDFDVHDASPVHYASSGSGGMYTTNHLVIACISCVVLAGAVGVLIGYRISRARALADAHHSSSSTSGSDYDSFGRQTARLTRHDSLTTTNKVEQIYGIPPQKHSVDATSLVLSMHPAMTMSHSGAASGLTTPSRDRNAVLTSLNNCTLPRDYKVKKVYL
ncbi:unnamed protein product, partial [Mesorhabditis belari]|uniref:Semaphorin-1A n=1 Tax=Mesorhabditis belari TaxID=2138241 RepID=A0AAF3FE93_9BILA